jgi:hypothetical protein
MRPESLPIDAIERTLQLLSGRLNASAFEAGAHRVTVIRHADPSTEGMGSAARLGPGIGEQAPGMRSFRVSG